MLLGKGESAFCEVFVRMAVMNFNTNPSVDILRICFSFEHLVSLIASLVDCY